jgi:hypothetical protein
MYNLSITVTLLEYRKNLKLMYVSYAVIHDCNEVAKMLGKLKQN